MHRIDAENLAEALTELDPKRKYSGGSVDPDAFDALNANGPWIARVKPPTGAHFVIVDGAENGVVSLRDPYGRSAPGPGQGLEGTVRLDDFMEYWRRGVNKVVFPAGKKN